MVLSIASESGGHSGRILNVASPDSGHTLKNFTVCMYFFNGEYNNVILCTRANSECQATFRGGEAGDEIRNYAE